VALPPVTVLIADDDEGFRRFVRTLLASEDDIDVVAEASDGEQAISLASEHAPNVVLMDVRMPKLSGIDATRVLNEIHPSTRVLMFTVSDEESDLFEAIKSGAAGYLLKDDPSGVGEAVRRVRVGQTVLSPGIAAKLIPTFASALRGTGPEGIAPLLTKREFQVLQQLGDGQTTTAIAESLKTSEATVNSCLYNVLHKLHRHFRVQAILEELDGGS
jgi:two-component system NarL family response regulator